MKKKLFLTLVMSMFCLVALAFAVSAKDVDININDVNGNPIVLSTVDGDGDPLTWYRVTEKPTEGTYFEYVDGSTTYYIVSVKTKVAAYVNDNYRVCYSYPGLKAGAWSGNIMVANLDGLTHTDGKGPEYLNFVFEGTPICYVYIPASILELNGTSGNSFKSLFYGCGSLIEVEFEAGSKIETLYGNGFYNCKKLTYIKLPENLKTISAASFVGINPTIVVPKSVTTFEASNWSSPTVQFTGTASDHADWAYQPSNIEYVEHCDVYHDGQHSANEDDYDCTTSLLCANCGKELAKSQDSHNIVTVCAYANGFLNVGVYESKCHNAGCNYVEQSKELDALFTCLGYSASKTGVGGIAIGFTVNNEAISEYEDITGKTLNYGVFAVAQTKLGTSNIFDENNNAISSAITADLTSYAFTTFEVKVVGFTDEQKDSKLAMGAYVAVTEGEETEYSYMQVGTPNANEKYCFVSYNDVVGAPSTNEDIAQ